MQAKAVIENEKNLYDYWGDMLCNGVSEGKGTSNRRWKLCAV